MASNYSSLTHCERYLIFLFFSDFFSDYLSKNAIDLENGFFFFIRNKLFELNEMFLIWITFV